MGYSITLEAVNRVHKFLHHLTETKSDEVVWQTPAPKKFQYYLHNGLIAAEELKHPDFGELKGEWKVRTRGANVVAIRKILRSPSVAIQVREAETLYDVIRIMTETKDSTKFNEILLDLEDLEKLGKWCENMGYSYAYKEGVLSVTKL